MRNYLDVLRAGVKQQKKMQTACFAVKWDFLTPEFAYDNYKLLQNALRAVGKNKTHYTRVAVECVPLYFSILYYWRSNEEFFTRLYDETEALYRLDQGSAAAGGAGADKDLGPLPATAKLLLGALACTWVCIIAYVLRQVLKKKQAAK